MVEKIYYGIYAARQRNIIVKQYFIETKSLTEGLTISEQRLANMESSVQESWRELLLIQEEYMNFQNEYSKPYFAYDQKVMDILAQKISRMHTERELLMDAVTSEGSATSLATDSNNINEET